MSPVSPVLAALFFTTETPGKLPMWFAAKSLQSCPTLCDPIEGSPPGSSIHGIFQARILEWVAIAFSEISGHSPLIKEIYYANRIGMLIGWTESLQN